MPGILETIRGRMTHATSGGLLSGLGGSGGSGILSTLTGPLQARLATAQAVSGGPMAKVQAILAGSTTGLGVRLRTLNIGGGAAAAAAAPAATDAFQVAGASRIYSSPTRPAGIEYK